MNLKPLEMQILYKVFCKGFCLQKVKMNKGCNIEILHPTALLHLHLFVYVYDDNLHNQPSDKYDFPKDILYEIITKLGYKM